MSSRRRGELLLLAGMLAGLALAAADLASGHLRQERLGEGVAALVNGRELRRADYERALAAVAADRREGTVDAALARQVLNRLIDEELLVQRGLELELVERDPSVRSALVAAVFSLYAARADDDPSAAADPGDAMLQSFLSENRPLFRAPPRLRVQRVLAPDAPPRPGDPPDALLPIAKLRDYLGEATTAALVRLPVSGTLAGSAKDPALRVVERQEGRDPALAEIRAQVLAEYRRQQGDRRLRSMLDERRRQAELRIAGDLAR